MSKPVIVIVPGSWHRPQHYQRLISELAQSGYEAVGVTLPSVDSSPPLSSWDQDAEAVRQVILKYLDAGRDVITLAHSFGGVPMSEGVQGVGRDDTRNTRLTRRGDQTGVYVCDDAPSRPDAPGPDSATDSRRGGGRSTASGVSEKGGMHLTEDGAIIVGRDAAREVFYNRCEPKDVEEAIDLLGTYPSGPLAVPVTYTAYLEIPSTYIVCENDRALLVSMQERMIAQGEGAFAVERCEGHSPFLSNPGSIVECICRASGQKA